VHLVKDAVAGAGGGFQAIATENADATTFVGDEAAALEDAGDKGDGGAAGAEHLCEELLGELEDLGTGAIKGREEPTGEAFFGAVEAITAGDLAEGAVGVG